MQKSSLLGAMLLLGSTSVWAQNYTATATAVTDDAEMYDYLWCDGYYTPNEAPEVEVYDQYMVVKAWCGATGYDLKVEYNEASQVSALTSIVDGVAGERKDAGYVTVPTPDGTVSFYIARNFAYATADAEGGYVTMSCYLGNDNATYYLYEINFSAPTESVDAPLYTAHATAVTDDAEMYDYLWCDGYYTPNEAPEVEVYDGYMIVKAWCGAASYDLKVEYNEAKQVSALTSIVDGVAGERKDAGYVTVPTPEGTVSFYIARNFAYANADGQGGYVTMSCYLGSDNATYYLYEIRFNAPTDGIGKCVGEEGEAIYYTINGVMIDRPTKAGVYIKRQGNMTSKIIIR